MSAQTFSYQESGQPKHLGLERHGPLLDVTIAIPNSLKELFEEKGETPPDPVSGKVLIDTGASRTCVDDTIVQSLKIQPIDTTKIITAGGMIQKELYPVILGLPGTDFPHTEFTEVIGVDLNDAGIIALLGRDVLAHFICVYNGPEGTISLEWQPPPA